MRKNSLAERAYLEIRNQILKGELPVGMALARRKLAAGLGVSALPVDEAWQRLESLRELLAGLEPIGDARAKWYHKKKVC